MQPVPYSFGVTREFNPCHTPTNGQFCSTPTGKRPIRVPKSVPEHLKGLYLKAREHGVSIHIYHDPEFGRDETSGEYVMAHSSSWGGGTRGFVKVYAGVKSDPFTDRAVVAHEIGHGLYDKKWPLHKMPTDLPEAIQPLVRQARRRSAQQAGPSHHRAQDYGTEFQAWRFAIHLDPRVITRAKIDDNLRTYAEGLGVKERDHQRALDVLMRYRSRVLRRG